MGTAENLAIMEHFAGAMPAPDLAQKILDPDSDEALMLRYRDGDFPAFETLYRRHNQRLFRFVAWQSPRIDWADEVAQDTWLRLHASRESYRPDAQFKTFLYQIAKNRLIDLMRQKNALLASDLGSGQDDGASLFDHIVDQYGEDKGPEAALSQRDRRRMLHDAIHALPHRKRMRAMRYWSAVLCLKALR